MNAEGLEFSETINFEGLDFPIRLSEFLFAFAMINFLQM